MIVTKTYSFRVDLLCFRHSKLLNVVLLTEYWREVICAIVGVNYGLRTSLY